MFNGHWHIGSGEQSSPSNLRLPDDEWDDYQHEIPQEETVEDKINNATKKAREAVQRFHEIIRKYPKITPDEEKILDWNRSLFTTLLLREGNVRFINSITDKYDTFPIVYYHQLYGYFDQVPDTRRAQAFHDFIKKNVEKINDIREFFIDRSIDKRIMQSLPQNAPEKYKKEFGPKRKKILMDGVSKRYRDILFNMAQVDRKMLKYEMFKRELIPKIDDMPLVMTFPEMYQYYKRNCKRGASVIGDSDMLDSSTNTLLDERYRINMAAQQAKYSTTTPWKTQKKVSKYVISNKINPEKLNSSYTNADSFNMKEQRKLMKHHVSAPHTFVIDYMYSGRFAYLMAINVNTRKAFFCIPEEITLYGHNWRTPGIANKDWHIKTSSAIESIRDLQKQTIVKGLIMDQESAWTSIEFQQFLRTEDIKYRFIHINDFTGIIESVDEKSLRRQNHSTTALIDRLIKTIRTMNYNIGNRSEIPPETMSWLIREYNNSPHTTLSKLLKQNTTPNDVDNNEMLERKVCSELMRMNFIADMNVHALPTGKVRVLNECSPFDKVKPKLLPGYWNVVKMKDGLVELRQNDKTIKVNRWMIKSNYV